MRTLWVKRAHFPANRSQSRSHPCSSSLPSSETVPPPPNHDPDLDFDLIIAPPIDRRPAPIVDDLMTIKASFSWALDRRNVQPLLFLISNGIEYIQLDVIAYRLSPKPNICAVCHKESLLVPLDAPKKRNINWLGLFLAKQLGYLDCDELTYFYKHNDIPVKNFSKVRLIARVAMEILLQLQVGLSDN
ncbi:hypothetical protein POM88_031895 [Heracleum sosnowskyi]|uniref:DUF7086 domain-containing protein n=1 Tax=Heracleum sosnowskyi TaxID=360622 RepID=A0AAD8I097_9APIA|nr:hypothetical protein POM88_031895 [Heracleum sosnowskyi]